MSNILSKINIVGGPIAYFHEKQMILNLEKFNDWLQRDKIVQYRRSEMKYLLLGLISLISFDIQALEYEIQLENELTAVGKSHLFLGYLSPVLGSDEG